MVADTSVTCDLCSVYPVEEALPSYVDDVRSLTSIHVEVVHTVSSIKPNLYMHTCM